MGTKQAVAGLNGLGAGELAAVGGQVLERLGAAAATEAGAVDRVLLGLLSGVLGRLGSQVLGGGVGDEALADSGGVAGGRRQGAGEKLRRQPLK